MLDARRARRVSVNMIRRALVLAASFVFATAASAAWYPSIDPTYVRVEVGQTKTATVRAIWTGIWVIPWTPWVFVSSNPSVAQVAGRMDNSLPGTMYITGVKPGNALATIDGWTSFYSVDIDVVCGREDPIQAALPQQHTLINVPVALRALTPIANRTSFTWYHGHIGDLSHPINGSGFEIPYVTNDVGAHYAWVLATTPCSQSMAEFRIDAHAPKRRLVRR